MPNARIEKLPVLDLDGACEFLELTRPEIMVFVPQAMIEIRQKFNLLRQGIDAAEISETPRHAHTLKSVAASIGAETVRQAAETLEAHAIARDCDKCAEQAAALEQEIVRLTQAVSALPSE